MIKLLPLTLAMLAAGGAYAQEFDADVPLDPAIRESIELQAALLRKIRADEQFLAAGAIDDDTAKALDVLYTGAQGNLGCLKEQTKWSESDPQNLAKRRLLCADIAYRKFLLEKRIGFWGGVRNLVPEIPPIPLKAMKDVLASMVNLANESDVKDTDLTASNSRMITMLSEARVQKGKEKANEYSEQNASTRAIAAETRKDQLKGRLDALWEQRQTLRAYEAEARNRLEAAEASMGDAMVQGLTAASGAPPWVVNVAKGGSPEKAMYSAALGYVQTQLATNADLRTKLTEHLGPIREGARNLGNMYAEAVELKQKVDLYKGKAETMYANLRQPTVEGVLGLGQMAWESLPSDQRAKWMDNVKASTPILELTTIMAAPGSVKDKFAARAFDYVANSPAFNDVMAAAIDNTAIYRFTEMKDDAAAVYAGWLKSISVASLSGQELIKVADSYFRADSAKVIGAMSDGAKAVLKARFNLPDELALSEYIAKNGISAIPVIKIDAGEIRVIGAGSAVVWRAQVSDLITKSLAVSDMASVQAEAELRRAMKDFASSGASLRKAVVDIMPPAQVEVALRTLIAPSGTIDAGKAKDAWKKIVGNELNDVTGAYEQVAATRVGMMLGAEEMKKAGMAAATLQTQAAAMIQLPPRPAPPKPDDAQKAAMMAAQAAFPGVMTGGLVAKKLMDSLVEMDAANSWLNDIRARLEANLASEARVRDLHEAATVDSELSNREIALHTELRSAYAASFDILASGAELETSQQSRDLARIARRRTLILYLAEQMRMHFDAFNLAISRWGNFPLDMRNQVFRRLGNNPQNLRLALDPEIQLFRQFDRDGEASKTDIDRLVLHWRSMVQFAEDACAEVGCDGARPAATINETELLSLCTLLNEQDRAQWRNWQKSKSNEPFKVSIFLDPAALNIDAGSTSTERAHRIVDLRAAPTKPAGTLSGPACREGFESDGWADLPSIKIAHSGTGYIYRGQGVFDREVLLPRVTPPGESPKKHFSLDNLKARWSESVPRRKELEGLPLFTELQITMPANPVGKQLSDLRFRIAYQYVDNSNVLSEEQYVQRNQSEIYKPYQYQFELSSGTVSTKNVDGNKVTYNLPAQTLALPAEKIKMVSRVKRLVLPEPGQPNTALALIEKTPLESADVRLIRGCRSVPEIVDEMVDNKTMVLAEQINRKHGGSDATVSSFHRETAKLQIKTQVPLYTKQAEKMLIDAGCQKPALELIAVKKP